MNQTGKKIPDEYENPFDIYVIKLAELININVFRPLRFTPNILTTLSLICGLTSGWLMYKHVYFLSSIMYLLSYLLDCCDGNYARMFNMTSYFGDIYDHVSDIVKIIPILLLIWFNNKIKKIIKIIFFCILTILFLLANIHLGCQEKLYNKDDSKSLASLKYLCPKNFLKFIKISRYFGVGTLTLYIILFITAIPFLEK